MYPFSGQPIAEMNGMKVSLPKNFDAISVSAIGNYLIVSTHFGVKIIWDGHEGLFLKASHSLYVTKIH